VVKYLIVFAVLLLLLPGLAIADNRACQPVPNCNTGYSLTISGTKFLDNNGNGIQDCGEHGISGVTIELLNSTGQLIARTTTDRNGGYEFDRLKAGVYTVQEEELPGYLNTTPSSVTVKLGTSPKKVTLNFGDAKPATITGLKYDDLNHNARYDLGEPALPGWTILLNNSSGNVGKEVTGSNGIFQFTGLKPGRYTISEVLQSGYTNTSVLSRQIIVTSGQVLNVTTRYGLFGNIASVLPKYAYVVNDGSNNVTVFNTATNTVVTSIPVGDSPWHVAISPDGTFAYVTNQDDSNVSVINTTTNTVVNSIPVGVFPTDVAFTPNGAEAYVTNGGDNTVSAINTATNAVTTIPVGFGPNDLAITPDGAWVYVAQTDGNISVINTATNTVDHYITLDFGLSGIAITPDNSLVFATNLFTNNITVVSIPSDTIVATISVGASQSPSHVIISPDGTLAYVTDSVGRNIAVINVSDLTASPSFITTGGIPSYVAFTQDSKIAYVTINNLGTVITIDTATEQVTGTSIPVGSNPQGIAINPDSP
jgi:YVTN family beta-propeller protein